MREQSEYDRGPGADGKRSGRLHVRNCHGGCDAYKRRNLPGGRIILSNACNACTLRASWMAEAEMVIQVATLPDEALDFGAMPYWLAHGVGVYRAMNRGGF